MKWKTLVLAFLLVAATATVSITASTILTSCSNLSSMATFDSNKLLFDINCTTMGGGDPLPGGGIPT